MMTAYRLTQTSYILPTPAGTYYAVSGADPDRTRRLLLGLLAQPASQRLSVELLFSITGLSDEQTALELLHRAQGLGWIQGEARPREAPPGILEEALPAILGRLSSSRKALLVDDQGLLLSAHGFSYELAEELSALSADLATLYQRHRRLLHNNINIASSAWALVNAHGDSQLGVWPLHIGACQFHLVLAGVPQFNQPAFVELVWLLSKRYLELTDYS